MESYAATGARGLTGDAGGGGDEDGAAAAPPLVAAERARATMVETAEALLISPPPSPLPPVDDNRNGGGVRDGAAPIATPLSDTLRRPMSPESSFSVRSASSALSAMRAAAGRAAAVGAAVAATAPPGAGVLRIGLYYDDITHPPRPPVGTAAIGGSRDSGDAPPTNPLAAAAIVRARLSPPPHAPAFVVDVDVSRLATLRSLEGTYPVRDARTGALVYDRDGEFPAYVSLSAHLYRSSALIFETSCRDRNVVPAVVRPASPPPAARRGRASRDTAAPREGGADDDDDARPKRKRRKKRRRRKRRAAARHAKPPIDVLSLYDSTQGREARSGGDALLHRALMAQVECAEQQLNAVSDLASVLISPQVRARMRKKVVSSDARRDSEREVRTREMLDRARRASILGAFS